VQQLLAYDFLPLLTVARTSDDQDEAELFAGFVELLRSHGYSRPRVKILPTLRLGAEAARQRGYHDDEFVTPELMDGFDPGLLLCSHARLVSDRGVHVCPILLEAPDSVLGQTLAEATAPFALRHHACYTCYQYGSICANPSAAGGRHEPAHRRVRRHLQQPPRPRRRPQRGKAARGRCRVLPRRPRRLRAATLTASLGC